MRRNRKFPRLSKEWKMNYNVLDQGLLPQGPLDKFTLNISGGGICFKSDEELEPDTMIGIEMQSEQFPSPILALARVAWCKRGRDGYEVGAEFWWNGWKSDDAQQAIADYISSGTPETPQEEESSDSSEG